MGGACEFQLVSAGQGLMRVKVVMAEFDVPFGMAPKQRGPLHTIK